MHNILQKYLLVNVACFNFDADSFMQSTVDQPLETEFKLVPEGEYDAMIGDFTSEALTQIDFEYKRGEKQGQPGTMLKFDCPFTISNDPRVKEQLGRDSATVFGQLIIDRTDDGRLDFGPNKNVKLGQIRAAVDQNNPGAWTVGNLRNAGPLRIRVDHIKFKRKDGTEGTRAEVTKFTKISS